MILRFYLHITNHLIQFHCKRRQRAGARKEAEMAPKADPKLCSRFRRAGQQEGHFEMTTLPMNPLFQSDQALRRCPRFETCTAALCALGYAAGRGGVHLDGEEICPVALEFKKKNGLERLRKGARQLQRGRGEGE